MGVYMLNSYKRPLRAKIFDVRVKVSVGVFSNFNAVSPILSVMLGLHSVSV